MNTAGWIVASSRRGMTLVEMLVATTMTLIIMGMVAQLFGMLGTGISGSRATMEMTSRMRGIAHGLRMDLAGITAATLPPLRPDADAGYFELIEGPMTDISNGALQLTGDCDDIVMFTARSFGSPFVGRYTLNSGLASTIQSPVAEIAYFCRPMPLAAQIVPGSTLHTLHRRQLLVMAYMGLPEFPVNARNGSLPAILNDYDVSLRGTGSGAVRPNSLSDLTKRENRFLHNVNGIVSGTGFPFDVVAAASSNIDAAGYFTAHFSGTRAGEDIILDNVLAFDVKVFDPAATVVGGSGVKGEYVDLGSSGLSAVAMTASFPPLTTTVFQSGGMQVKNASSNNEMARPTYDTFSSHYEANGLDEDGDGLYDEGTNGLNDGGIAAVADDPFEAETSPPYPYPLRGIEVRIRCYEPSSRQVRQVTVRHSFVPH
jgi:hypothetical protein